MATSTFKLENKRIKLDQGGYVLASVVFTDDTTASGGWWPQAEYKDKFLEKFGFSTEDFMTTMVSGYNLASPAEILPTYQWLTPNVSSAMYVGNKTFTVNGTKWRIHYDDTNHYDQLEYYDSVNQIWQSTFGSNPVTILRANASDTANPNVAFIVCFCVRMNNMNDISLEQWRDSLYQFGSFNISNNDVSRNPSYSWITAYSAATNDQTKDLISSLISARPLDPDDPYAPADVSGEGGGWEEGDYNDNSDSMPDEDRYNTSVTNGGFLQLFTPSDTDMKALANYLWSNSFTDTIKSIWDKIGSLGLSFTDYILSLHRLPVSVDPGTSKTVQLGWYPTTVNMPTASSLGAIYDFGSITIPKYYGNALDYKSRVQIYLPYVGFEDLDTQAVIGKPISLKYIVDYVSGDCQAQLFVDGQIHYQFKGNMAYHLPVGQDNFGDIIQQGIAIGTSMVTGGAAIAAASSAMKAMNNVPLYPDDASNYMQMTNQAEEQYKAAMSSANGAMSNAINQYQMNIGGDITRGGAVGGNSGWFACQIPFVIINRPRLSLPENFGHYHGYPSNITETLGNLRGYTQVNSIHLDDIGCSAVEDNMLMSILKNGFIIRDWNITKPASFTLYHNDSDVNVIGKDLTTLKTITDIRLKDTTSREKPTFLLTNIDDVFNDINYIYYPDFDRFYLVDSISSVRNGLWAIHCKVDVLQTYAAELSNLSAVISRQEYKYNLYLDDGTLASYANAMVQTINFPQSFNDKGSANILVILGS